MSSVKIDFNTATADWASELGTSHLCLFVSALLLILDV